MLWIKKNMTNKGIWLSFVIMFICYFSASIDLWKSSVFMDVADKPSAFMYSLEPILFGGVILVFPFCACLPVLFLCQTEDNKKKLTLLETFFLGGAIVTIPFISHTILWNIIAIPVNPSLYASHELSMYGLLNDLYGIMYGVPVYGIFSAGMFLCGGTMALIYLVSSVLVKDQISSFIVPSLFYFGWLQLSARCKWIQLPAPVDLFDEGLTVHNAIGSLLIYFCVICLMGKIYQEHVKKERKDGIML